MSDLNINLQFSALHCFLNRLVSSKLVVDIHHILSPFRRLQNPDILLITKGSSGDKILLQRVGCSSVSRAWREFRAIPFWCGFKLILLLFSAVRQHA